MLKWHTTFDSILWFTRQELQATVPQLFFFYLLNKIYTQQFVIALCDLVKKSYSALCDLLDNSYTQLTVIY